MKYLHIRAREYVLINHISWLMFHYLTSLLNDVNNNDVKSLYPHINIFQIIAREKWSSLCKEWREILHVIHIENCRLYAGSYYGQLSD